MFTERVGYVFLVTSFVLSVACFLYLNVYQWTVYPAVIFSLLFIFQLFGIIKNSNLAPTLKKDIYILAGLLLMVILANILWVFVFTWFRYIASVSALVFVWALFAKLKKGIAK